MRHVIVNGIIILVMLVQSLPINQASANTINSNSGVPRESSNLDEGNPPVINTSDETGAVTFIGSSDGEPIIVPEAELSSLSTTEKADAVLGVYAPRFGVQDPQTDLSLVKSESAGSDRNFFRYQQTYQGVPVFGGDIALNLTTQGDLSSMSGEASPNLSLSTSPQISADQARSQAEELMVARYGVDAASLVLTDPELWIYDERLIMPSTKPAELVWRMEATAGNNKALDVLILVNAVRGGISLQFNQVDTDVTGRTWLSAGNMQDELPTEVPTEVPTEIPTDIPTEIPLPTETLPPTEIPVPTEEPALTETPLPTEVPTDIPTEIPTDIPTETPTDIPTETPTATLEPTEISANSGINWYVATTGSDANDCLTTTSPCATIQGALDKAASADIINITAETYYGTGDNILNITKNITLIGGWDSLFFSCWNDNVR